MFQKVRLLLHNEVLYIYRKKFFKIKNIDNIFLAALK